MVFRRHSKWPVSLVLHTIMLASFPGMRLQAHPLLFSKFIGEGEPRNKATSIQFFAILAAISVVGEPLVLSAAWYR